jgi:imidazolonepropionase-like amidohydrolase
MKSSHHILVGWLVDGSGEPARLQILMKVRGETLMGWRPASLKDLEAPRLVDLSAFTVLPGLVDAHVHLSMSGTEDPGKRLRQIDASFEETLAMMERHVAQNLARGVVALRHGGDGSGHGLRYKKEFYVDRDLSVALRVTGPAWHAPGRYGKLIGRSPRSGERLAEAVMRSWAGSDHVKILNSGLNSLTRLGQETAPQFGLEELVETVKRAHASGRKVMVHANGSIPSGLAIEAGCDSIEHGFFMGRANLEKMADRGTVWVPTLSPMAAHAQKLHRAGTESEVAKKTLDHQLEQIRLARELGVLVAAGTDAGSPGVDHGEALVKEIRLLMTAGFTLEEAVRCASAHGAALLGVRDHTGLLAPGSPATFVAVKGAPEGALDGLSAPHMVVIKGRIAQASAFPFAP